MPDAKDLSGRSILVVEDDFYLASDTERALRAAGAEVVGPVPRATLALAALAGGDLDAAVVDINLGEGPSFAVAEALKRAGVPFVFVTAQSPSEIPEQYRNRPVIPKPYYDAALCAALASMLPGTTRRS